MANINIGDEVRFINEPLQGTVTSLKVNGIAGVTIEDGFEIDVPVHELVVITKSAAPAAAVKKVVEEVARPRYMPETRAGYLWQISETDHGFIISFWNNTENPALCTVYREGISATELMFAGKVEGGDVQQLSAIRGKERSRRGKFHISLLTVRNMPARIPETIQHVLNFDEFNAINPDFLTHDSRHWLQRMENAAPVAEKPTPAVAAAPVSMNISRPEPVVDLHAGELGIAGLDGDAILKKQMETFHRQLELGIAWQLGEMTFIHGSGAGVLRNLIRIALKGHPGVKQFSDADPARYGQGAVQVVLK